MSLHRKWSSHELAKDRTLIFHEIELGEVDLAIYEIKEKL